MINELFKFVKKPELEAHLDPDCEGSSRPHVFIDKSVEWIEKVALANIYKKSLDLGCGPGIYTERLFKKGYDVTGIDYSKRSINSKVKTMM